MKTYLMASLHILDVLPPSPFETFSNSREIDFSHCDIFYTSPAFCEKYGWSPGINGNNLGKVLSFPNTSGEVVCGFTSLYLLSNAVWKTEPPIELATKKRVDALKSAVEQMSADGLLRYGIIVVDMGSFSPWLNATAASVKSSVNYFNEVLGEIGRINVAGV